MLRSHYDSRKYWTAHILNKINTYAKILFIIVH